MTKPEDAASVHSGHRQRLKDQFLTHGMDPIHDVNVLELILFYAIPRQDTNPIAHRLLSTFGSLAAVFDATPEELSNIKETLTPGAVVTTPRNYVDYIVTEFGIAQLKGRTIRERADALISIAHPDDRAELRRQAKMLRYL